MIIVESSLLVSSVHYSELLSNVVLDAYVNSTMAFMQLINFCI